MRRPIESPLTGSTEEFEANDELGVGPFVKLIQRQLFAENEKRERVGLVVGLTGPWGSGKSWVLNWVKSAINEENSRTFVIDFNPWKSSRREDLVYSFLDSLRRQIDSDDFKKLLKEKSIPQEVIDKIEVKIKKIAESISEKVPSSCF